MLKSFFSLSWSFVCIFRKRLFKKKSLSAVRTLNFLIFDHHPPPPQYVKRR